MKPLLIALVTALTLGSTSFSIYLYDRLQTARREKVTLARSLDEAQRRLEGVGRQLTATQSALRDKEAALSELQRRGNIIYKLGASVTIHCLASEPDAVRARIGSTKLGTLIRLVLADGTAHRLANRGFAASVAELQHGGFAITFFYESEDDRWFFAQQINVLAQVKRLSMNYSPILSLLDLRIAGGDTLPSFAFSINEINVVSLSELSVETGDLASGEATFDVSEAFARVSQRYTEEIQLRIRSATRGSSY